MTQTIGRITPERVKEAFEKTGFKPGRNEFFPTENCACGLGAVYAERNNIMSNCELSNYDRDEMEIFDDLSEAYSTNHDYLHGFAVGFDGQTIKEKIYPKSSNIEHIRMGVEDGRAAYRLLTNS